MGVNILSSQGLDGVIRSIPMEELRHMQRVGGLTNALLHILLRCRHYQDQKTIFSLFGHFAFYHDIGKAWIPADILGKEEPLTFEEFETITMHPLYAQGYFEKNPNVLNVEPPLKQCIFDAAVFHHERWDGSGYPYGISSDTIPLIARVTSVCDAYDAITHKRPYREAKTHADACEEIAKHAGTQFDPDIALIFLENEKDIGIFNKRLSNQRTEWEVPDLTTLRGHL